MSVWARNHLWPARLLIVTCHLLLITSAIITGLLLNDLAVFLPAITLPVFTILFLIGMFFYPGKDAKGLSKHLYYVRRKSCDGILAVSTFLMFVFTANHYDNPLENYSKLNAATLATSALPRDSIVKTYKTIPAFNASMKDENGKLLKWKERKKLMKEQLKGIKKATNISSAEKTMLAILTILVALALMYVVIALACGLACNGADGAALLVLIGGTAVVVFLSILVFRAIYRDRKTRRKIEGMPG